MVWTRQQALLVDAAVGGHVVHHADAPPELDVVHLILEFVQQRVEGRLDRGGAGVNRAGEKGELGGWGEGAGVGLACVCGAAFVTSRRMCSWLLFLQ